MKVESIVNLPEMGPEMFIWEPHSVFRKILHKAFPVSEKSSFIMHKFPPPLPSKEGLVYSYYVLKWHTKPMG